MRLSYKETEYIMLFDFIGLPCIMPFLFLFAFGADWVMFGFLGGLVLSATILYNMWWR